MQTHPCKIGSVTVGAGAPCRFVAELSNNHNGDIRVALQLLRAAKHAGADFVKVQCYTPDELVALRGDGPAPAPWGADGWSMYDLYRNARTPDTFFPILFDAAALLNIPIFASVFGADSLAMMQSLDCAAYKIARLDNHHTALYDLCVATGKPVIVSAVPEDTARGDLTLWCPPGYPQASDVVDHITALPQGFDGLSYHGVSPLPGAMASHCGAAIVEVHLQLSATPSKLESTVSLTEYQFAAMVALAHHAIRVHT